MSGKESIHNGIIVIVILIGLALATVLLPDLMGDTSASTPSIPAEAEIIELTLPTIGSFGGEISLTSIQILGILAGIVFVPVIGTGVILGFLSVLAAKQTESAKETSRAAFEPPQSGIASLLVYKPNGMVANLIKRSGEKYQGRTKHPVPSHKMPRWSVASTALVFLMFAAFLGYTLNDTFFPEGEVVRNGRIISSTLYTVGGTVLITLLIILWRIRPQKLEAESSDASAIPWDFIAVLFTGLIVVGLGIGYIVYLNFPT